MFNSCGTYEALSVPGDFNFKITFSHHITDMHQQTVQAKLYCFNDKLIIKVDTYELTYEKHKTKW